MSFSYLDERNNDTRFAFIDKMRFTPLTNDTIEKISQAEIIKSDDSVSDLFMGSTSSDICKTCKFNKNGCTGHGGHMALNYPLIHPFWVSHVKSLLKCFCLDCSSPFSTVDIESGATPEDIVKKLTTKKTECRVCGSLKYSFAKNINGDYFSKLEALPPNFALSDAIKIGLAWTLKSTDDENVHIRIVLPHELIKWIDCIPKDIYPYGDSLIIKNFYITSNNSRPAMRKTGSVPFSSDSKINQMNAIMSNYNSMDKSMIDQMTNLYNQIIKNNFSIKLTPETINNNYCSYFNNIKALYKLINASLIDSTVEIINKDSASTKINSVPFIDAVEGLNKVQNINRIEADKTSTVNIPAKTKSQMEKLRHKKGMIRQNILGKRAHNIGRSVVDGDPTLNNDEIGIPFMYAKQFQNPEIVTEMNIERLTTFYNNSKTDTYPCLSKVSRGGKTYKVNTPMVTSLNLGDCVYRDLIDGDIVLLNRQPSLLYTNTTAFRVRVKRNKDSYTVSFNVTIAHFFNADFDGDQMNVIHLNYEISRLESIQLSSAHNFCISKQTALANLGQTYDSIIGCFLSTMSDAFVDYYRALCIMKNVKGDYLKEVRTLFKDKTKIHCRELHSLVIPENINLEMTPSWYNSKFDSIYPEDEKKLVIKNGKIISGILDKKSVNISAFGSYYQQIHYEYDSRTMLDTVFNNQQIAIGYTLNKGFSLGIKDIINPNISINKDRTELLTKTLDGLRGYITDLLTKKIIPPVGYSLRSYFEEMYLNRVESNLLDVEKHIDFYDNNLFQLIQTGSKGKMSVMRQMVSHVGMVKINGKMPPELFSYSRFLPYYQRYEMTPEAFAFVKNSYFSGLSAPEFLPATMQSRNEIIVKALMTAVSGEQNRSTIKALESNIINESRSVVNSAGVLQEMYGGDCIDIASSIHIDLNKIYNVKTFDKNALSSPEEYAVLLAYFNTLKTAADRYQTFQFLFHDINDVYRITTPADVMITLRKYTSTTDLLDSKQTFAIVDKFCKDKLPNIYLQFTDNQDNIKMAIYKSEMCIRTFLSIHVHKEKFINKVNLIKLLDDIYNKISYAIIPSGYSIGIITAQCVSEPATQKTLDTHHGAAQEGGKKSSMGRIKELVGGKDNETINMLMRLRDPFNKDKAELVAKSLEIINLGVYIDDIEIHYISKLSDLITNKFKSLIYEDIRLNDYSYVTLLQINRETLLSKSKLITYEKIITYLKSLGEVRHTPINSPQLEIMVVIKKNKGDNLSSYVKMKDKVKNIVASINDIKLQGVDGIEKTNIISIVKPNISPDPMYLIVTTGYNIREIYTKYHHIIETESIQIDDIKLYNRFYGIVATKEKLLYELRETIDTGLHIKNYEVTAENLTNLGYITSFEKVGLERREKEHLLLRLSRSHPKQVLEEGLRNCKVAPVRGLSASLIAGQSPKDISVNSIRIDIDPIQYVSQNKLK